MRANIKTEKTSKFLDIWAYLGLGSAFLVFLALVTALFLPKKLLSTTVNVAPGKPLQVEKIQLKPSLIGALRIDVKAIIKSNQWVVYEIQLLDAQGKVIGSAMKEAWKESGTWREGGESGSWSEEDLLGGLDVKAKNNEEISIVLSVLSYGKTSGEIINSAAPLNITIKNGVVDTRYLWPGLFGSLILGFLAYSAATGTGKKVINKTIMDSDVSDRAVLGGKKSLVKLIVNIEADETCPYSLQVQLVINNVYGERLYSRMFPVFMSYKHDNGRVDGAVGKLETFFILEEKDSYGFYVEVMPDASVDKTVLSVFDKSKTVKPVEVITIGSVEDNVN